MKTKIIFKSGKKKTIKSDDVSWTDNFFAFHKGNKKDHSTRITSMISMDSVKEIQFMNT